MTDNLVVCLTERERTMAHLRNNPPPDAGREYGNPDGLLAYMARQKKSDIARTAAWIKMHYVNTESLMLRIRKVHHAAKS